jgi:hypothetical protein
MRPKIVITVLLLALGLLAIAAIISKKLTPTPAKPVVTESSPPSTPAPARTETVAFQNPPPPPPQPVVQVQPQTNHDDYVRQRSDELADLAMNDDTNSLNTILSEVTNPDPQIRQAARDAVVQFGDRSAIPKLSEIAEQTDDPQEKAKILEAIDFLKLPTLTEFLADEKAAGKTTSQPPSSRTNRIRSNAFDRRPFRPNQVGATGN